MWWLMTRWTRSQYTAISQHPLLTEDDPEIGDALKEERERGVRRKWQIKPAIKCNFSGVLILIAGATLLIALTIQCTIWYLLSRGMPGLRPTEFCKNGRNLRLYGTMIDKLQHLYIGYSITSTMRSPPYAPVTWLRQMLQIISIASHKV